MNVINENGLIKITGRIDTTNSPEFQEKMLAFACDDMTIDASELEYISSAGLRVFLKLKKSVKGEISLINASPEIYDIFEVTGFTNLINVTKKLKEIDITGCEVIGEGANGKVYRIDDETIIKVFSHGAGADIVQQERDFARSAFIAGVPTAISYDVVKCRDCYGAVYEMLNAQTVAAVIKSEPERAEELGKKMGALLKELHSTKADTSVLNNMLDEYRKRAEGMAKYLTKEETEKIKSLYFTLKQCDTVVHGDFHSKNVMLMNDELIFIDMGDVGYGHPLLDIGGSYLGMMHLAEMNPDICEKYVGINAELCKRTWKAITDEYFGERADEGRKLAKIYGEAKYSLTPYIYNGMKGDMIENFVNRVRINGILADSFDISLAFENNIF